MARFHSYRFHTILAVIMSVVMLISISCRSEDKKKLDAYETFNLGVKAVKSDNIDLAGHYFKKAVILDPGFTEARLNLANVDFLNGDLEKARNEYIKLLEEKVYDPRLLFNLGWIYLMQEDYKTAGDLFRKSRRVDASFTDSDYGLAMLAYKQNEDALTQFHLEQYIKNSPEGRWSKKAHETLALVSDDVITSDVIDTNIQPDVPDNSSGEIPVANPVEIVDSHETETPVFDDTPEIKSPEIPETVIPKKESVKEPPKTPVKKPVVKKPVKSTSQLIKEGTIALNNDEYSTAESRFKQALKQDSKSVNASKGLARVYFAKGNDSLETKYLKQYIDSFGGNPKDGVEIANGFEAIGDYDKAIEYYQNYLKNNPFGTNAAKAKERLTQLDSITSE